MKKLVFFSFLSMLFIFSSCEPRDIKAKRFIREGVQLSLLAKYDEAAACFEKAKKLQPEMAEPWFQLANLDMTQRNFEEALNKLNKAIELDSTYGIAYANRARVIFILTGDRMQACPDWINAQKLGVPSLYDEVKHCPGGLELFKL
jgi:tetratricopeptide (TPR) repeat protein